MNKNKEDRDDDTECCEIGHVMEKHPMNASSHCRNSTSITVPAQDASRKLLLVDLSGFCHVQELRSASCTVALVQMRITSKQISFWSACNSIFVQQGYCFSKAAARDAVH